MKAYALRRAVYALISACMALYTAGVLADEELEELFVYHQELSSMPPDTGPATIAEHEVTVDTWALARSERHAAEFILPDGSRFRAVPEEIRYRGDWRTDFAWRGKLEGDGEAGRAVITVHRGHIAGLITIPQRNTLEIKPGPEAGVIRLLEIDDSMSPDCDVEHLPPRRLADSPHPTPPSPTMVTASSGNAPTIDVLVVYTPLAESQFYEPEQIFTRIQSAVDVTNDAYANSEVYQRVNLLPPRKVLYYGDQNDANSYDQLDWVTNDAEVASWRDQYQADLVVLFSGDAGTGGGLAWIMNNPGPSFENLGYSMVVNSWSVSQRAFAHELGHNMGLEHDSDNSGATPETASYPWSFGHVDLNIGFRTIMAGYSFDCPAPCPKIDHFSNPSVFEGGFATGIEGERDNARTLNLTANVVADFRQGDYLYADRFEDRGYALSGITGPPPMTHAESCAELEKQLSLYETRLAEKLSRLSENDDNARREYEEEAAAVAGIREQLAEECQ